MFKYLVSVVPAFPIAAQAQTTRQAAPAEAPPITVNRSASLTSDYRFRSVPQSDRELAVQGGPTISHDSGVCIGAWGSNLAGWVTFGRANLELDVGAVRYIYSRGADKTHFVEPYAKLTGTAGPATPSAGIAYAPQQGALDRWRYSGADAAAGVYNDPGAKERNLYLWSDDAIALAGTPLTAKAFIGYSDSNPGPGPNATIVAPTPRYWDWCLGLDASNENLTLGVAWIDTGISERDVAYLRPSFSKRQNATSNIAGSTSVASLTTAF